MPQYYITQQQHPQPGQYVQQQHQPQQQQQQQQLVYDNYADISYVQDNALYDQQQQVQQQQQQEQQQVTQQHLPHSQQQQQYYVPAALAEQLMTQILQEAGIQSSAGVSVQQQVKVLVRKTWVTIEAFFYNNVCLLSLLKQNYMRITRTSLK